MTAIFSTDRDHRFRLERPVQAEGLIVAVIMVNPSRADEAKNDQTVTKLLGFGKELGWRQIIVGNKFSQINTDVRRLRGEVNHAEAEGYLRGIIEDADIVVVAWGTLAKLQQAHRKRWIEVTRLIDGMGKRMYCLGVNDDGHPRHPLMVGYDAPLVEWHPPWFPNRTKPVQYNGRDYPL